MKTSFYNRCLAALVLLSLPLAGCDFFPDKGGDDDDDDPVPLTVSLYAEGLLAPAGVEMDAQGRLWVTEAGTAQNDGRISVVTSEGEVFPFLTGLPSEIVDGQPSGPWRSYLRPSGDLLIVQGSGSAPQSQSLLVMDDAASFDPGDAPRPADAAAVAADIGAFVLGDLGLAESNPYALAFGPDGDQYVVDAAANAIVRRDAHTGALSLFVAFEDLPNPTPVGPPSINAVPTDIVYAQGRFFVSALTGFPFPEGAARIYEVDLDGNVALYRDGFTALTALAVDERDGNLLALQFAAFSLEAGGWVPETGQILKVRDGGPTETVVGGLNLASDLHASAPGELFVASIADGEVLRITYPE